MSHVFAIGIQNEPRSAATLATLARAEFRAQGPAPTLDPSVIETLAVGHKLRPECAWFVGCRGDSPDLDLVYQLPEWRSNGAFSALAQALYDDDDVRRLEFLLYDLTDPDVVVAQPLPLATLGDFLAGQYAAGAPMGSVLHTFIRCARILSRETDAARAVPRYRRS